MGTGETAFDTEQAIFYARLVTAAYDAFKHDKTNNTPDLEGWLPDTVELIAYVQMKDFIVLSGDYEFYGFVVRHKADPRRHVLAIRGTSDPEEWWDDFASTILTTWSGDGRVGFGFHHIYRTLRAVRVPIPGRSLLGSDAEPTGTFAEQVAQVVTEGSAGAQALAGTPPTAPCTIEVTGHSLGSALATLYVAEDAARRRARGVLTDAEVSTIYTFASPLVGDAVFAAAFDALPITSWRVVNELDIIPRLPPALSGFQHVQALFEMSSTNATIASLSCFHSLQTYMHMLVPKISVCSTCARPAATPLAALRARLLRGVAEVEADLAAAAPTESTAADWPA